MSLPNSSEHLLNATSTISDQNLLVAVEDSSMTPINGLVAEAVEELIAANRRSLLDFAYKDWLGRRFKYLPDVDPYSSMTAIQTAVINGQAEEVEELMAANPLSLLDFFWRRRFKYLVDVGPYSSMTSIQTAVINGQTEMVEELIAADPRSVLVRTAEGETLLHLAVKHSQSDVCQVLLKNEMIIEYRLPNCRDKEGNTILHLAISNKQVEVVNLLLPGNSTSDHLVDVNSRNKKGLTAWDLLHRQEISGIEMPAFLEALAVTVTPLPPLFPAPRVVHLDGMQVHVAYVGILAGTSIGIVCNIPSSFSTGYAEGIVFKAADVLAGRLPPILYLMVLNNAVVAVSLGATVKEMWKLPFKPVLIFVSITMCFVYALLVDHVIPKFWVRIGSLNVVSSAMVWLLSGAYVASPPIAYYAGSYGFGYLIRLIKPLISKIKRELRFRGNGHILP